MTRLKKKLKQKKKRQTKEEKARKSDILGIITLIKV